MLWKGFLAFHLIFPSIITVLLVLAILDPSWWSIQYSDRICSVGFLEIECCDSNGDCQFISRPIWSPWEEVCFYFMVATLILVSLAVFTNVVLIWTNLVPHIFVGIFLFVGFLLTLSTVIIYPINQDHILSSDRVLRNIPGQTYFVGVISCVLLLFASTMGISAERYNKCHRTNYDSTEKSVILELKRINDQ